MTPPGRQGELRFRAGRATPRRTAHVTPPRRHTAPGVKPSDVTPPPYHTVTPSHRSHHVSKTRRDRFLIIRCTPDELGAFHRLAAQIGVTTSELVRGAVFGSACNGSKKKPMKAHRE